MRRPYLCRATREPLACPVVKPEPRAACPGGMIDLEPMA
jgi:hypothetical protein